MAKMIRMHWSTSIDTFLFNHFNFANKKVFRKFTKKTRIRRRRGALRAPSPTPSDLVLDVRYVREKKAISLGGSGGWKM